jgi:hypothetical protein
MWWRATLGAYACRNVAMSAVLRGGRIHPSCAGHASRSTSLISSGHGHGAPLRGPHWELPEKLIPSVGGRIPHAALYGVDVMVRNMRYLLDEFAGEHEHQALLGPGLGFESGPSRPRYSAFVDCFKPRPSSRITHRAAFS